MIDRKFKLDIKVEQTRHADPEKYIAYVLWLIGHSERAIALVLGFRRKQISGIIGRSEYKNRAAMTDQERRKLLAELEEVRFLDGVPIDNGRLDKIRWEIIPLGGSQLRGPMKRKMR